MTSDMGCRRFFGFMGCAAVGLLACVGCGDDDPRHEPQPSSTSTASVTASPSSSPTRSETASATPTPSATPSPTSTATASVTASATPTATSVPRLSCEFDRFHGCQSIHVQASGHFRIEQIDGVWWLITPEGNAFFSAGVNSTRPDGDYAPALGRSPYQDNVIARYGSEAAWADVATQRFADLQLTTIGAWSRYELFTGRIPYTPILDFAGRAPAVPGVSPGLTGLPLRDYFAPAFADGAAAEAQHGIDCEHDPFCIGVFSDNELGWGPGVAQSTTFLDGYMRLPAGAPGKMALQEFLEEWSADDISAFNTLWNQELHSFDDVQTLSALPLNASSAPGRSAARQAFAGRVARRYYQVVHDALRSAAPQVLILGSRLLAYSTAEAVAQAMSQFVDVVSINQYELNAGALSLATRQGRQYGYIITGDLFSDIDAIHDIVLRPMLISEFGYRAADSGLPNSYPPLFPTLATQVERADAYERYMRQVLARPYLVGAHWFEYADEPASGRFDGEDSNWGIVSIEDDEYHDLAARMRLVNADMYQRRSLTPR